MVGHLIVYLGWVDFVFFLFHCQPDSTGADENQAVLA